MASRTSSKEQKPASPSSDLSLNDFLFAEYGYIAQTALNASTSDFTQSIANFALVEWSDNIDISDQPPYEYFPVFQDRYNEAEWKNHRMLHALPDGCERMKYPDFLMQRRKQLSDVIRKGFEKI